MGRPRQHDETTGDLLLEHAEEILATAGPEGLSVRSVAAAAGTTVQAIYSVFGSKDGLLRALYTEAFRKLEDQLTAVPATDDPRGDLVRIATDAFRPWALGHPGYFRLAFEQLVDGVDPGTEAQAAAADAFAHLQDRIRRIPGTEAKTVDLALQFHALCQGLASSELQGFLHHADSDPSRLWADGFAALVEGSLEARAGVGHGNS